MIRKFWVPISVFLVLIVGISLYYLQTRPPKPPIKTYTFVEPLPKTKAQAPIGDTSREEHSQANGMWKTTEPQASPAQPAAEVRLPQTQTTTRHPSVIAQEENIKAEDNAAGGTALLEDPVLAELNAERLQLLQRQAELKDRLLDHISAVHGSRITASQMQHGTVIQGSGLPVSQVERELEDLRIASENLQKAQAQWRRKYFEYTGTEHPGTRHWVEHAVENQQSVRERAKQMIESQGKSYILMDP